MIQRLVIFALLAALFMGCVKEQPAAPEETPAVTVSFTLPNVILSTAEGSRGALSRAAVPALDAEKVVSDMDIFVCAGGQFVRRLVPDDDYTQTDNGDQTTIDFTADFIREFIGRKVVFWFVANNASSVGGLHIGQFSGTQQQFEDLRTTPLGDSPWYAPGTKAELICTKDDDGNTYGLLMTGRSAEILIAGKHSYNVTLRRRAARFDIENPAPARYKMEEIYISDAKVQAPMFGTSAADHSGIATRSLEEIVGPKTSAYDAATKIAPCVFYLYPTDLETTTIAIQVTDLAANPATSAIFTLDVSKLTNKKIEANTRYIIYFDADDLEIGLRPGDYNNP